MFCVTNSSMQLSFEEQISHFGMLAESDSVKFFNIFKQHFDIRDFIPKSFYDKYYSSNTNNRDISLESILSILFLLHLFRFGQFFSFNVLLSFAPDIREFCRLKGNQLPHESVVSKFKTTFDEELLGFFNQMSLRVIDIFSKFNDSLPEDSPDKNLNEILIYDTSGVKLKVKENNPKFTASAVIKFISLKKVNIFLQIIHHRFVIKHNKVYTHVYAGIPSHSYCFFVL